MDRFYKSDAVAFQWLQHRDGERARLEAEYTRLRTAVGTCSNLDVNLGMDVQNRLTNINQALEVGQVLSTAYDICRILSRYKFVTIS